MNSRQQELWRQRVHSENQAANSWGEKYEMKDGSVARIVCVGEEDVMMGPAVVAKPSRLVPGYAGHIPKSQFVFSKTFGDITRDIPARSPRKPSDKHSRGSARKREFKTPSPEPKRAAAFFPPLAQSPAPSNENYRPPGYSGFVPGNKSSFATTFTTHTRQNYALEATRMALPLL